MGIKDFLPRGGFGGDGIKYAVPVDHFFERDPRPPRHEPDVPIPDSAPPFDHLIPDDSEGDDTAPDGE